MDSWEKEILRGPEELDRCDGVDVSGIDGDHPRERLIISDIVAVFPLTESLAEMTMPEK